MDYQDLYHEAKILWTSVNNTRKHIPWPKFITKFAVNPAPYEGLPNQELKQRLLNSKVLTWLSQTGKEG